MLNLFRKMAEFQAFHGNRVILRAPVADDFEQWAELRQKSRAFLEKWEPAWQADEFSKHAFRQRLRIYNARARDDQAYAFFLFSKEHGQLIGGLTLSHIRRGVSQAGTLGYWIGLPYARQGYMTDAIDTLTSLAATRFGLHRVEAACLPNNLASRNLLAKCGFEQEGYAKSYVKIAGQWEDHVLFAKLTTMN
jgi:[ribosomal protein S5]-alanine N-acetyltransferase